MTDKKTKDIKPTEEVEVSVGVSVDKKTESKSLIERILSPEQWIRFAFMLLFAVILCLLSYLVGALILLQFIFVLVTGKDNEKLRHLGSTFSTYVSQILRFLTYNTEDKPFPFADWPG